LDARQRAAEARHVLRSGRNPIEVRRASRDADDAARSFGQEAEELVVSLSPGFRTEKHGKLWASTLRAYAAPIWNKPVAEIVLLSARVGFDPLLCPISQSVTL
jgi:hypothetical protein